MNRLTTSLLCFGFLLCMSVAGSAFAQTTPDKGQMYEDIEIMGRILDRALSLPRYSNSMVFVNVPGGLMPNTAVPSYESESVDLYPTLITAPNVNAWLTPPGTLSTGTIRRLRTGSFPNSVLPINIYNQQVQTASVPVPSYLKTQGIYVKDQGIIFTVILPPPSHDPRPTAIPAVPKGPTEWERVRQELRGEKTEASPSKPQAKEPTVADLILETLAKNGHHFAQLGAKESLTVSIIFRPEEQGDGTQPAAATNGGDNAANPAGQQAGGAGANAGDKKENSSGANAPAAEPTTPKDYELLGDLHLKQGQSKEALKAYQKAAEKNPDPQHAAAMYLKMAQIYLTAENNKDEAERALDKARQLLPKATPKKEPAKAKKVASPLPSRLIITVPKNLLDLAGNGNISLEEFKKGATVEYLPFAAAKGPAQE